MKKEEKEEKALAEWMADNLYRTVSDERTWQQLDESGTEAWLVLAKEALRVVEKAGKTETVTWELSCPICRKEFDSQDGYGDTLALIREHMDREHPPVPEG